MKSRFVLVSISATLISLSANAADSAFSVGFEAGQSRAEIEFEPAFLLIPPGVQTRSAHDERDTAVGLYVGYAFTPHIEIEFAYADLGESQMRIERDFPLPFLGNPTPGLNPGTRLPPLFSAGTAVAFAIAVPQREIVTVDSKSFALSLIGRVPLQGAFSLIGRAGLSIHSLDADLRVWFNGQEVRVVGGDREQSSGAALLGAGVEWNVTPDWHVRAQVQRHFVLEDAEFISSVQRGDVTTFTIGAGYRF